MFKSKEDVSSSEVFALLIEVLLDIYQEYAQQIQGYQWWIYRQDIERYRWTCLWDQTVWISGGLT